jgi:transposase
MPFIPKDPRNQLAIIPTYLEELINQDNSVRLIDQFVDGLDINALGFSIPTDFGRPAYHPSDLLKLYIYGYMNRIRSSRALEKECHRNVELMWLLGNLKPDHNTINRFRKDNPKAIKRVFRQSVSIAQNFNLIGGILIAGDSTKLRAQNSKKNNFNKKKVQRHLQYIDKKIEEYNATLASDDASDQDKDDAQNQINKHKKHKRKYTQIQQLLNQDKSSENPQISTSDPDSRHQIVRGQITEVAYTAQTTVDAKNNLLIDYLITNQNDKKAMGQMLRRAKSILKHNHFTALYDKGYHTGSELATAHRLGIKTLVAIPAIGRASQAPNPAYNAEHFIFHPKTDSYSCPQGHSLASNGSWYKARNYRFKQYKTKACKKCPVRQQCTTAKANGKIIQRSEFTPYIEANARAVAACEKLYQRRQAIVEHPFGTIKRQWGFDHIITKKYQARAASDFGLIAIAYNLKRLFNLLPQNFSKLKNHLNITVNAILYPSIITFKPNVYHNTISGS